MEEFEVIVQKSQDEFEKEIDMIDKMIGECIDNKSESYYRISQMLRLLKYDFQEFSDNYLELRKYYEDMMSYMEKVEERSKEMLSRSEKLEKAKKGEIELDIVSEIVYSLNKLNDERKLDVLFFIDGLKHGLKKDIMPEFPEKIKKGIKKT